MTLQLPDDFADSALFENAEALRVYLYLLCKAEREDGRGVKRGQVATSVREMAARMGETAYTIHKAVKWLEKKGKIKQKKAAARQYATTFTVCGYDALNLDKNRNVKHEMHTVTACDTEENEIRVWKSQTRKKDEKENAPHTPLKEERRKNFDVDDVGGACDGAYEREEDGGEWCGWRDDREELTALVDELTGNMGWLEATAMHLGLHGVEDVTRWIPEYYTACIANGKDGRRYLANVKFHFNNWLRKRLEIERNNGNNDGRKKTEEQRRHDAEQLVRRLVCNANEELRRRADGVYYQK